MNSGEDRSINMQTRFESTNEGRAYWELIMRRVMHFREVVRRDSSELELYDFSDLMEDRPYRELCAAMEILSVPDPNTSLPDLLGTFQGG